MTLDFRTGARLPIALSWIEPGDQRTQINEQGVDGLRLTQVGIGDDGARDRHSGGAGIGLAIAERVAQLHGGTIHASNAGNGGLQVEISIPISSQGATTS